jgi:hypothetical protein
MELSIAWKHYISIYDVKTISFRDGQAECLIFLLSLPLVSSIGWSVSSAHFLTTKPSV